MTIAPLAPTDSPTPTVDTLLLAESDGDQALVSRDLSYVSTRELRVLCNQLYRSLDMDFPPYGAQEDYAMVADELEQREAHARERTESAAPASAPRETFRDNPLGSRFEFFHDGVMSGYVKYDLRAGHIWLLETVVTESYRGRGLASVLIREALLNAHQRRLKAIPYCPHAQAFLTANPQFTTLIPAS